MNTLQLTDNHEFYFSVVTAAYNAAPWIDTMLSSLVQQSLDFEKNIQVIIVDDGSTDETADVCRTPPSRNIPHNIVLLHQENSGPASARNSGLELTNGEWVTFIDADDFVAPSYFQVIQDFLTQSQYDGACHGREYAVIL